MKQHKPAMRSVEAWKKRILKDPKVKAAYDALEEEFALAEKKIKARKKKKPATVRATPPKLSIRRGNNHSA